MFLKIPQVLRLTSEKNNFQWKHVWGFDVVYMIIRYNSGKI